MLFVMATHLFCVWQRRCTKGEVRLTTLISYLRETGEFNATLIKTTFTVLCDKQQVNKNDGMHVLIHKHIAPNLTKYQTILPIDTTKLK